MLVTDYVILTKRKALLLFAVILILCIITTKLAQSGWNVTESYTIEGSTEPIPVLHREYLGAQNIISLGLLLFAAAYAIFAMIITGVKSKGLRLLLTIIVVGDTIVTLFIVTYARSVTFYKDTIGLHIDQFFGMLLLLPSLLSLLVVLIFWQNTVPKNEQNSIK